MATILKLESVSNEKKQSLWSTILHPLTGEKISISTVKYVDSINKSSYMEEMFNITIKYIRENSDVNNLVPFKKDNFMAKDYNDIYYNKKDGYWIIINENTLSEKVISLYKRKTNIGMLFNTYSINLVFTLSAMECSRIVPIISNEKNTADNFVDELKKKVSLYGSRLIANDSVSQCDATINK